jgi:non-canonical (house-cleaning) NTP pyrophosphatase
LNAAKDAYPDADYFISMEAGVINLPGSMVEIGYIAVSQKGYERIFFTEISRFEVPTEIARLIREGMEKGPAVDQVFNKTDSKKAGGLIGEVTDQVVTRTRLICLAAEIAFSQLKNKHLYPDRR